MKTYVCEIGLDFYVDVIFIAGLSKSTITMYYNYSGGWKQIGVSSDSSDFKDVFEFKVPLKLLGLKTGQIVGIYAVAPSWNFARDIPQTGYLAYPPVKDSAPPVTAIAFEPRHQVGSTTYVSSSTLFELSASDDASGVKETRYRIDDGPWTTYSAGFTLSTLPDGKHTIRYYSVDNAGNTEAEKTLTIVLDKTPPTISEASPTGTIGSTSVTFTVKVEDSGSGVKEVRLIVDGVSQGTMSQSGNTYTKTISLSEGSHTWVVESVDNVGNTITQNYSLTIAKGLPIETYLTIAAIVIVVIIAITTILLRRRKPAPLPPPPPP